MEDAGEPLNAVHIHSVELISFSVGDGSSVLRSLREWHSLSKVSH